MQNGTVAAWKLRQRRANGLLAMAIGVALAFAFCPRAASFLPACPIHHYLGLLCPGCGGTRAILYLLHADIRDALRLNTAVVLLLPFGLWFGAESYRRAIKCGGFEWPKVPAAIIYSMGAAGLVFAVIRNIAG
jgi:hypothetical protein